MNMIDCATKLTDSICSTLVKNNITHVGRYLPTNAWKALTADEVSSIKNAGLNLISIFEKGSNQTTYFTKDQGVQDANDAYQMAKGLGQPEQTAIYFTVDFDAQTKDFVGILNYFQGLKDTLKSYKIGVYGKYQVVQLIQSKGLADYFYQTYAWSSGQHMQGLHIFQYKNDVSQFGINLDFDQVENADCGAWSNAVVQPSAGFITQIKVLCETDIRVSPQHDAGYLANGHKDQIYNVIQYVGGWYQIALNDQDKGWIDGANVSDLSKQPGSKTKTYKIQDGQTLTKIASIFNTTVQNLLTLNPNISNPNKIYAGQSILVPSN